MKIFKIVHIAVVLMAMLFLPVPATAKTSTRLQVNAAVLPYMNLNAVQNIRTYSVKADDLQRGYVELPGAMTVNLRTNVNKTVTVLVGNDGAGRLQFRAKGEGVYTESSLVLDTTNHKSGALITEQFDSRIMLPADAKEGVYALNISLTPGI